MIVAAPAGVDGAGAAGLEGVVGAGAVGVVGVTGAAGVTGVVPEVSLDTGELDESGWDGAVVESEHAAMPNEPSSDSNIQPRSTVRSGTSDIIYSSNGEWPINADRRKSVLFSKTD